MEILHDVPLVQVEPEIPIHRGRGRGRGRPPILNKKPLVRAEPSVATRRGRGRPPSLHKKALIPLEHGTHRGRGRSPSLHKKTLTPSEHGISRGRGRPRKQRVSKPIIDLLPFHVFKKPRTSKAKFVREIWGADIHLPSNDVRGQALELVDAEIQWSFHDSGMYIPFVDEEASPSTPPHCTCYQAFSEIEIPGSVPDFDLSDFDEDLMSNFFEDIPDVSCAGGWCKCCKK